MISRRLLALAPLLALILLGAPALAATVPETLSYEGRLLDGAGNPVTSAIVLRFSLWKSADWTSSDVSAGAINTGAANYGAWYETQTVTPNANGNFQVQMGGSTALPSLDFTQHKFLQVEVKSSGEADTAYVLLDPTGDDGADAVDRKTIAAVAYAKNAESVGNRTTGTSSGNLLLLGPGGKITNAQMGGGTASQSFGINSENAAGDATLTFGNLLLPETLKYSASHGRFEFSADVYVNGSLTAKNTLSGSALTVTGLKNCDSVDTDAAGNLVCGTDSGAGAGLSEADANGFYVRKTNDGGLSASGTIATDGGITINKNNAPSDAVLTFGSSVGARSLLYSADHERFEFDDGLSVHGDLTVSGSINGVDLAELAFVPLKVSSGGGLTIRVASGSYRLGTDIVNFPGAVGVSVAPSAMNYVFFGSGGLTVRTAVFPADEAFIPLAVVTTSSTGVINVTGKAVAQSDTREQTVLAVLTPEFDKAVYKADGADNVGQLTMTQDGATLRSHYQWTSSRTTPQDYDILVRFLLPQGFVGWETGPDTQPLQVSYRTTTPNTPENALDVSVYDADGSAVSLTGGATGLASASWTVRQLAFSGAPAWTAGREILLKFHVSAKSGFQTDLGSVELRYRLLTGE